MANVPNKLRARDAEAIKQALLAGLARGVAPSEVAHAATELVKAFAMLDATTQESPCAEAP